MLAVLCTQKCVFYLCEGEVCVGYTVHHKGVFYLCEGEVCVGHTIFYKVWFTNVKERCVLAVLCTTRCVLPL